MTYFSRRNEYVVEYSGHEEVSRDLRNRLFGILKKYVESNIMGTGEYWSVEPDDFYHAVKQEFPGRDPFEIMVNGEFHEVFTVIEIFLELANDIYFTRKASSLTEVNKALLLSGSVYAVNPNRQVVLKINPDTAEKIDSIKSVLAPYPEFSDRFYQAVGNLVGRRAKPEDVVKDIFVAAEGYFKALTGVSRFGDAIKVFEKQGVIKKEQKKVLEALNTFASDASGARHAGNGDVPTEESTLWFLDTLVSQMRAIDKASKSAGTVGNSASQNQ